MNKKNHRTFGYIRRLPSKMYQASYLGPDGRRYYAPRPFVAKADADGFLANEQTLLNREKWTNPKSRISAELKNDAPSEATLREIFPKYLLLRSTRTGEPLRRQTKDLYERQMYVTMSSWLDVPLSSITKEAFITWYMNMQKNGKRTTASKCYSLMRAVLGWAVEEGLLPTHNVYIKGGYTASTGRETEILSETQIKDLANAMSEELRFAILIAAYGALRFSEVSGLRRKDLEFTPATSVTGQQMTVNIVRGSTKVKREKQLPGTTKYEMLVGAPKTKMSERRVQVHSGLIPIAIHHLDTFVAEDQNSLLFGKGSNRDELMSYDYFECRYAKAKKEIGCAGVSAPIHSLRKFGATQYANSGANLNELSEWLGDKSTEAIKRYIKSTGRATDLANKMNLDI